MLVKFPKLKLCLAHFGGDEWQDGLQSSWITEILSLTKEYSNVYTDFSCWNIKNRIDAFSTMMISTEHAHIRDKLIFGSDWYMTLVALNGKSYQNFCEDTWEVFNDLPDGINLWVKCTFLNPFDF